MKYWQEHPEGNPVEVSSKVNFVEIDHAVLKLWKEKNIFLRTISEREGRPDYIAYDGPPGTNGKPHIGHMMQSALKDLWPRFYTMKGYRVLRKAGWDTHGLPVELTAEKELGLNSKADIVNYGVEKYIDYCRQTVIRYKEAWNQAILRIGRFLDTEDFYATMTTEYIQTDWWAFNKAWDMGLVYQGRRVMPHCTRCGTSLSAHETAQGYRDISDISLYVMFPFKGQDNTFFVAWTTTAWTLLSNVALAVNPDLEYITIEQDGRKLIIAQSRAEELKAELGDYNIIESRKGAELAGLEYEPLWEFQLSSKSGVHRVLVDNFVTADDGSGIVHLALYGEDDFRLIRKHNISMVQNVDIQGIIKPFVTPFAGRYFRDEGLDVDILKNLQKKGLLFAKLKIKHSYPHCYRCDTPLMYFAKKGWFIKTSALKDKMLEANSQIKWYPNHIKDGRFGKWLENNVDWAISRERFWGSPLPIWTCDDCGEQRCFGSLSELSAALPEPLPSDFDPHKPQIDAVKVDCKKCNSQMSHEPEIIDPWFNAGIMPWGQWGYPAAAGSEDIFEKQFPADFICEAIDQTRGWFYTLLATSTILTGKSSFKNVICTEHVLDDSGMKMSKSRGNIVDSIEICEKFGADAVRWNFYATNPWTVRLFKEKDIREVLKQVLIPYWNSYSFLVTYLTVDKWKPSPADRVSTQPLDRWILSRFEWVRGEVEISLENYDVAKASNAITIYLDELTNWYIRRSRRRFWKSQDDGDKRDAYQTLYTVICKLNRILAPFIPFTSEVIYQNLERQFESNSSDSVHLCSWVEAEDANRDLSLEHQMATTRKIVSAARALRNEGGIRVRQPLREVVVAGINSDINSNYINLIKDELNVKNVRITSDPEELFSYKVTPNFKVLGPKVGAKMKEVAALISELDSEQISRLADDEQLELNGFSVSREDLIFTQQPASKYWVRNVDDLTVAVAHAIDHELRQEWLAREFVHHVQNLRRAADLKVTQRIRILYSRGSEINDAVHQHQEYICNETLAVKVDEEDVIENGEELVVGKISLTLTISAMNERD